MASWNETTLGGSFHQVHSVIVWHGGEVTSSPASLRLQAALRKWDSTGCWSTKWATLRAGAKCSPFPNLCTDLLTLRKVSNVSSLFRKTDFLKVICKIRLEVTPTTALCVCHWDRCDLIILHSLFSELRADSSLVPSPALSLSPLSSSVTPTGRLENEL